MPGNKQATNARQQEVIQKRMIEGKCFEQIGKEMGTSESTARRDWMKVKNDDAIEDLLTELKSKSLINAIDATDAEGNYLVGIVGKESMTSQEAATASTIGVNNQKRYSFLAGERTDEKGGEKINPELQEAIDGLLKRIL